MREARLCIDDSSISDFGFTRSDDVAFVLGGCGAYVVAALARVGDEQARQRIATLCDNVLPVHFLKHGSDELFVGRAGFLAAIAVLRCNASEYYNSFKSAHFQFVHCI